ncbi:MAG: bacteriohemerythrin [Thermodesulfobacteriota bacterium]
MGLIQWNDEYSVKVRQFDNQHRKLIDIVNQLHDAMKCGKGSQIMNNVLASLAGYTQAHFSEEERLMRLHGFPGFVAHKRAHDQLVERIREFQRQAEADGSAITLGVMVFLKDWLVRHIQGEDVKYGPYLNMKGVA